MRRGSTWCRVCGDEVRAGEGVTLPEPEFAPSEFTERATHEAAMRALPVEAGEWRHTCTRCEQNRKTGTEFSVALKALLNVEESEAVAARTIGSLTRYNWQEERWEGGITAQAVGRGTGKPWAHVDQRALDDLNALYAQEKMRDLPKACKDGGCYWCGVRTARDWFDSPYRWRDGTPAPLCSACFAVFDLRGRPTANDPDAYAFGQVMHVAASEAATGYNVGLGRGVGDEFRVYGETRECDKTGHDLPWTYSPKVIAYREEVWTQHPEHAPADRREEFEQKRADRLMKARAQRLAESREVAARAW